MKKENIDDVTRDKKEYSEMKMVMVGVWCFQTAPSHRPSISKVVEMLHGSVQSIWRRGSASFGSYLILSSSIFSI